MFNFHFVQKLKYLVQILPVCSDVFLTPPIPLPDINRIGRMMQRSSIMDNLSQTFAG